MRRASKGCRNCAWKEKKGLEIRSICSQTCPECKSRGNRWQKVIKEIIEENFPKIRSDLNTSSFSQLDSGSCYFLSELFLAFIDLWTKQKQNKTKQRNNQNLCSVRNWITACRVQIMKKDKTVSLAISHDISELQE